MGIGEDHSGMSVYLLKRDLITHLPGMAPLFALLLLYLIPTTSSIGRSPRISYTSRKTYMTLNTFDDSARWSRMISKKSPVGGGQAGLTYGKKCRSFMPL